MKRTTEILAIIIFFLLMGSMLSLAMSSVNYQLEWFTPGTTGGGGSASSAHYTVNLTIGQSATGIAASTAYKGCLGYWCGVAVKYQVYVPLILRKN